MEPELTDNKTSRFRHEHWRREGAGNPAVPWRTACEPSVGKERKTLRWSRRAVMTVIDTLHAEAQAKAGVPKRRRPPKTSGYVIGKSAEELFAEFNMGAVQ